jgi:hypothetical protein
MEAKAAFQGGDDPEDFPGKHLIVGRSVNEEYRQIMLEPRQVAVWSAMDHGENFVDLAGPSSRRHHRRRRRMTGPTISPTRTAAATATTRKTSTSAPTGGAASLF